MKRTFNLLTIFLTLVLTLSLTGCNNRNNNTPISKTGFYFDTVISITLYNPNEENLIDKCFEMCKEYESLFSRTIINSDISNINNNPCTYVKVSNKTIELIEKGLEYSKLSEGVFDISIGSISALWDFSSDTPSVPDESQISSALKNVDYKNIFIKDTSIMLNNMDTIIDLGGIAKGYIADELKAFLIENGVKNGIIDLGGNILLIGSKPDNSNYNIGIKKPFTTKNEHILTVKASDKSIVSSGNYERYFYDNNILYHHILDTSTGYPVNNELTSVTIISDKSIDGDALSTTCFALGTKAGIKLIENKNDVEAIFIDSKENITTTSGLKIKDNIVTVISK